MGCSPSRGQAPISGPSSPLNQITSLAQITWLAEVPRSTEALLSGGTFQGLRGDLPGTENKALTAHHETNVAKCSRSGRTLIRLSPQIPLEQNFPKRVLWNPSPSAHDGEETSKIKEPSEPLQQGPSSLLSQRPTLALQEPLPLETLSHFPSPGIPLTVLPTELFSRTWGKYNCTWSKIFATQSLFSDPFLATTATPHLMSSGGFGTCVQYLSCRWAHLSLEPRL